MLTVIFLLLLALCAFLAIGAAQQSLPAARTMGRGFLGLLLLGAITTTPELYIVATGSQVGQADLLLSVLLGANFCNLAILFGAHLFSKQRHYDESNLLACALLLGMSALVALSLIFSKELSVLLGSYLQGIFVVVFFAVGLYLLYAQDRTVLDERYQLPTGKNISSNRLWIHAGGLAILGAGIMHLARVILGDQALGVTGGLSLALIGSIPELLAFGWLIRSKVPQMGIGTLLGACLNNLFLCGVAILLYPKGAIFQDLLIPKIQLLFLAEALLLVALCYVSFLSKGSQKRSEAKQLELISRKQR